MTDETHPSTSDKNTTRARKGEGHTTRERILTAAAEEFSNKGFEGAMLETIASKVGIRAASLFHHFPNGKNELYEAVFRRIFEAMSDLVGQNLGSNENPFGALHDGALLFWDFCEDHPAYIAILLREMLDPDSGKANVFRSNSVHLVKFACDYIREAQERGDLARFDPYGLLYDIGQTCITTHATPAMFDHFWPDLTDAQKRLKVRHQLSERIKSMITVR